MVQRVYQLPLRSSTPQTYSVSLAGTSYNLTFVWNAAAGCWMMSIADANKAPLASSLPVVCGRDILDQFAYLGILGHFVAQTDNAPDEPPTYENFGLDGKVYFVTDEAPAAAAPNQFVL